MHYSAVDYWTPGWNYPRSRLREPFPRRGRRVVISLPSGEVLTTSVPARSFVAGPRETCFAAAARGVVFGAAPRGTTFAG
ncbi:MAG: hypothetical protein JSS02_18320 [Planctomycetes bacterium]|nr:hypothetical protein [Planctomycetota bacterium]